MNLIHNQTGMTQEHSRICLEVILVTKQPSKVNFGTHNWIFNFWEDSICEFSSKTHLKGFWATNLNILPVEYVRMDHTDDFVFGENEIWYLNFHKQLSFQSKPTFQIIVKRN